jgi:23S rRNA pseudouridine1911/1915/1917 synthase
MDKKPRRPPRRPSQQKRQPNVDRFLVQQTEQSLHVEHQFGGMRLDKFIADRMSWRSRTAVQRLIDEDKILVDGVPRRASYKIKWGETVVVPLPEYAGPTPEVIKDIPLDIIAEDDAIVVINKQPGIVVHPVGGKLFNTILNALHLRYRRPDDPPHDIIPKLAHRIDKDTSGVLVATKTDEALRRLRIEFEKRLAQKEYLAIVEGEFPADMKRITYAIARDKQSDIWMKRAAVSPEEEAEEHEDLDTAETLVEIEERFKGFTLLRLLPKTGRTHQLRVHLSAVGHPILCDRLYSKRESIMLRELDPESASDEVVLHRQALHAWRLRVHHPMSNELVEFVAPLPADMLRVVDVLRRRR